jgi:hypothetical protein
MNPGYAKSIRMLEATACAPECSQRASDPKEDNSIDFNSRRSRGARLESRMHFRSVLIYLWLLLLLSVPTASAQKRVYASVDPNVNSLNRTADLYDPQIGRMTASLGNLNFARKQHVSVRMGDGKVLLAGGYNNRYMKSAEIFNPSTGRFALSANTMIFARAGADAVPLRGGTVLIIGGYNGNYLDTAETYDPAEDAFTSTATNMTAQRYHPVATLLSNGDVLVTGGYNGSFLNSADVYYPTFRTFISSASTMADTREGHTGTLLQDGKVLLAGGCTAAQSGEAFCTKWLASSDIYDPGNDKFTATGSLSAARSNHTATLLLNGKVLIVGGINQDASPMNSAEIYDPSTGKFTSTGSMSTPRIRHTATLLPDGKVLIAGGYSDHALSSSEIYDPQTEKFTPVASPMTTPRSEHTATALMDGRVLLAGGQNSEMMVFDGNSISSDNISPNIVFSPDSKTGFVSYTGSGSVLAFSPETGAEIKRLKTGGNPIWITLLPNQGTLAVVSALDNRIFILDPKTLTLITTYSFSATFGYGSMLALSPDGNTGYISSAGTGEVIKFDVGNGKELGRLKSLQTPGQITVTKDGKTLIVVDVEANELVFAEASSMNAKYKMTPTSVDASASFAIFNSAVLNDDETFGLIASQDGVGFIFKPATGAIDGVLSVGATPGYTMLTPGGLFWLVLCDGSLAVVPTWAHDSGENYSAVQGTPLASANIVISPDIRYAYYTSAISDRIYQHDFSTGAVVGSFPVGDGVGIVQASSLAFTPDYRTLAVVNFESNELELLSDTTVQRNTKFRSEQEKFTGISIVNVSGDSANVTLTAIADGGVEYSSNDDNFVNPVSILLPANTQKSVDVAQLFNLNTDEANSGYLVIESDKPVIAGYSDSGQIHSDFLDAYLSNVQGIPLYPDYRDSLHDWIVPEVPQAAGTTAEFSFVNPNYNNSTFDVTHYGSDGTVIETKNTNLVGGSQRQTKSVPDLVTALAAGQVLIVGGFDSTATKSSAELFNLGSNFQETGGASTPRQGHSATMLRNEKVLVAGGKNGPVALNTAELYDAVGKVFITTGGSMNAERYRHTATLLSSGKVLLAGGQNGSSINKTAELYDPVTNAFALTAGAMASPRDAHTATLLPDGRVLITGGLDGVATSSTAEFYNPSSSTFNATGSMGVSRAFHTAVQLRDGKVLIAGGYNGAHLDSAELYDPATGVFAPTGRMTVARSRHTATLLEDGMVLITGGMNTGGTLKSAELFDPNSGLFFATANDMASARSSHTATLYSTETTASTTNTKVLIAGGNDGTDTLKSGETYDPVKRQFVSTTGDMITARQGHTALLLLGGSQGYLRIKSDYGMLFTEIYDNGGADAGINGINLDKFKGIKKIYSPQFALLPDYQTLINLINGNENEATVAVTLHAPDGTVLANSASWVVPRNAQIKGNLLDLFQNDPRLINKTGWIEVTSSRDLMVGTVSFTNPDNDFLAAFELSATPLSNFLFPLISEDFEYGTGIALLNSGDAPAVVQMELWGSSGTLDSSASIVLAPHMQRAEPLGGFFPNMRAHRYGNVRIRSSQPLHSFAVMYSLDLHFISAVTAVPYPGQ